MGGGYSGQGGGKRDNRAWGAMAASSGKGRKTIDGYTMFETDEAIFERMGLGNGGEADQWQESLTGDEAAAVYWYSNNGHAAINRLERDQDPGNWYTTEQAMKGSTELKRALDKGSLDENIIVTRTSGPELLGGATTVAEIRKRYGEVVQDPGFTSTELNQHTSETNPYGKKHGSGQVTYHIKIEKGKGIGQYIRGLTGSKQEQEFLFNKGSAFKILGAYADANGMTHVNLKYVGRTNSRGKTKRK